MREDAPINVQKYMHDIRTQFSEQYPQLLIQDVKSKVHIIRIIFCAFVLRL